MQNDYWEMSEQERAALTAEQVEAFTGLELMRRGCVRAVPLVLEPEPTKPEPTTTVVCVKGGKYGNRLDVAFHSFDDALAFLALKPMAVDRDYIGNECVNSFRPVATDSEVNAEKMFSDSEVAAHKSALTKANESKEANRRAREEHDKAVRAEQESLVALWSDWRSCREKEARADRVLGTFTEYVQLCKDDREMARTFLAKAYTREQILEAKAWWGDVGVDLPKDYVAAAPQDVTANGTEAASVDF